jgi:putative Mn2+ efflux pump MntP
MTRFVLFVVAIIQRISWFFFFFIVLNGWFDIIIIGTYFNSLFDLYEWCWYIGFLLISFIGVCFIFDRLYRLLVIDDNGWRCSINSNRDVFEDRLSCCLKKNKEKWMTK